jgi:2-keto-4-pentenoate hydratase/2-oxohepta-3-ene-1,7-dioic acid hydratase in catechol pathway
MDKIICAGKNFLEHARELGDAVPESPVLFLKPPSVLRVAADWGETLAARIPRDRGEVHFECEIALRLSEGGSDLSVAEARSRIEAVTLGLDLTLREVQGAAKRAGHPWTLAKVFADAAVLGPWIPVADIPGWLDEPFSFLLDGQKRQEARGREMRFPPAELVSFASRAFPLCRGDVLFTGTPAGVGPVRAGQRGTLEWGARRFDVLWS